MRGNNLERAGGTIRLTKRVIDNVDISRGRHWLWDSELRGFGVQVEKTGTKTYIVRYRPKGLGRDGTRRFYKIGRHGDLTVDEARGLAKTILGAVASGGDPAEQKTAKRTEHVRARDAISFQALGQLFLDQHVAAKRKPRTVDSYKTLLTKHAYPVIGDLKAEALTRTDLSRLHLSMKASPHNANRVMAVVSSMYSFAAKNGYVPDGLNPVRGIEKYREEGRERYLTKEELRRLGAAIEEGETVGIPWELDLASPNAKHIPKDWKGQREKLDRYAAAAIRLLLFTGARLQEILRLRWRHVDLDRGLLFLPDSKTGRKTIVLSSAALGLIGDLMPIGGFKTDRERDAFVIRGEQDGKPKADLKRPWSAIKRRADLEGVRLHDLRHTFASIGAGSSLGLPIVGKLLGHSQPQTTARYAHLDADPLRRASDVIGDQLLKSLSSTK